jgi:hypothetical protein
VLPKPAEEEAAIPASRVEAAPRIDEDIDIPDFLKPQR